MDTATAEAQTAAVRVGIAQFPSGPDRDANLAVMRELAETADGARLLVFPEYAMHLTRGAGPDMLPAAESLDGPYVTALAEIAATHRTWIVAGMHERIEGDDHAYNTLVVLDDSGALCGTYRKIHLYDSFGHRESDWLRAGDPVDRLLFTVDGFPFGLMTCYDLRFPEMARLLVDAGARALIVPAAWVPGPQKEEHWRTLQHARAIENTSYVISAAQTAPGGSGNSLIVDPMGVAMVSLAEQTGAAVGEVRSDRVSGVREKNPSLIHRRYGVTSRI